MSLGGKGGGSSDGGFDFEWNLKTLRVEKREDFGWWTDDPLLAMFSQQRRPGCIRTGYKS